jgi:hypothetical protein
MVDVGDPVEVKMEDFVVAQGIVTEISDGQAYIDIPATRVVMSVRQSLAPMVAKEPEVEHQFIGTVNNDGDTTSPAKDAVTEVPPPNPEMAKPVPVPVQQQIPMSNESLRNQALDSSVLD